MCLHGGGTRIPFVQTLVREVCGPKPSFTLDSSACIATGAAIIASSVQVSTEEAAAGGTSAVVDAKALRTPTGYTMAAAAIESWQKQLADISARVCMINVSS